MAGRIGLAHRWGPCPALRCINRALVSPRWTAGACVRRAIHEHDKVIQVRNQKREGINWAGHDEEVLLANGELGLVVKTERFPSPAHAEVTAVKHMSLPPGSPRWPSEWTPCAALSRASMPLNLVDRGMEPSTD